MRFQAPPFRIRMGISPMANMRANADGENGLNSSSVPWGRCLILMATPVHSLRRKMMSAPMSAVLQTVQPDCDQ